MDHVRAVLQPYKGISMGMGKILTAEVQIKARTSMENLIYMSPISEFQMLDVQTSLVKKRLLIMLKPQIQK